MNSECSWGARPQSPGSAKGESKPSLRINPNQLWCTEMEVVVQRKPNVPAYLHLFLFEGRTKHISICSPGRPKARAYLLLFPFYRQRPELFYARDRSVTKPHIMQFTEIEKDGPDNVQGPSFSKGWSPGYGSSTKRNVRESRHTRVKGPSPSKRSRAEHESLSELAARAE